MASKEDLFQDMLGEGKGIFAEGAAALDDAFGKHRQVKCAPSRDGVTASFTCDQCGKGRELVVEWPELIAIKYNVPPERVLHGLNLVQELTPWLFNTVTQGWQPEARCSCSNTNAPSFTGHEADQFLTWARGRGALRDARSGKDYEVFLSQRCAAFAQQFGPKAG